MGNWNAGHVAARRLKVDFPFKPATPGTKIEIRGKRFAVVVVPKPIYKKA